MTFLKKKLYGMKYFLALAFIVAFTGALANAQDAGRTESPFPENRQVVNHAELKPHIGLDLGVSSPASNYNNATEYAIEAGFQPYIPYGLGAELSRFSSDNTNANYATLNRTKFLLRGTYNFGGNIPVLRDSYLGLKAGPVFDDVAGVTSVLFGGGAVAGFDIPLNLSGLRADAFSLGANVSYLFVSSTDVDEFALNGAVKYWF